jgi:viologen exporter family transport system permease protein
MRDESKITIRDTSSLVTRPLPLKYLRIWCRLAIMSFEVQAESLISSLGYFLGKLVRLGFFLFFLYSIFKHTDALVGYTLPEVALFFLTFNIVDILAQLFFRGIYGIRSMIREGDFDYFLIQPTNVLFRVAFQTVDFLDVLTILPVFAITFHLLKVIAAHHVQAYNHQIPMILYVILTINGLLIAFAIHIAVASLAVLTQELENTIWIYRDLMTLGRFPSDIYDAPMRGILTFIIPVAVMVSFPAKAFLGKLDTVWLAHAFLMATTSLALSLYFWNFATRRYTSVSS